MALYYKVYQDNSLIRNSNFSLPSLGTISQFRESHSVYGGGPNYYSINDYFYVDNGIKYPGITMSGDILNEHWANFNAWVMTGSGYSINPPSYYRRSSSGAEGSSASKSGLAIPVTSCTLEVRWSINQSTGYDFTSLWYIYFGGSNYIRFGFQHIWPSQINQLVIRSNIGGISEDEWTFSTFGQLVTLRVIYSNSVIPSDPIGGAETPADLKLKGWKTNWYSAVPRR